MSKIVVLKSPCESDADLSQWGRDCVAEFQVDHENEAFLKLVLLAGILGYRYVAFGMEYPTSAAEPPFSFYCNFQPDWQEKFLDRSSKSHGSKVCYGKRASDPLPGHGDYYWTRADFMREAEACGVTLEWLDMFDCRAGTTAVVGLGGLPAWRDSPELRRMTDVLLEAAVCAMETRLLRKNLPQCFIELNDVERRYLRWVLDGKTSDVIASIMDIRESQVRYMQRMLPPMFDRQGILPTAFLAWRLGLLTDSPRSDGNSLVESIRA